MNDGSFFATLAAENAATHAAGLEHPAVLGIGDGSLAETTFRYYIEQDYNYLRRYIRVLALAVAASPDLPTATRLAELVSATLSVEVGALVELYAAFGGNRAELDAIRQSPTCQAYTDHLLATATGSNLFVIMASVLPCQWGYREIGHHLLRRGLPADTRYARWIKEYASDEYGDLVDWLICRFDELAATESATTRQSAREAFALSTHYEHAFWEMAWVRERWA
ncbi:MAG TPA: thiaminase II [Thermomicrobiales bacterium]|nr:thiaminase II [Thermomicrobiales bacterium]